MLIDAARTDANTATDSALLEAIGRKDTRALRLLIELHGPWILGAVQSILGKRAQAEKVVEAVFLELWDHPRMFRASTASLRDNLKILARGRALDRFRSLYDDSAASRWSAATGRSSPRYVPPKPSRLFNEAKALPA